MYIYIYLFKNSHFRNIKGSQFVKDYIKTYKYINKIKRKKISRPTIIATFYYNSRRVGITYNNVKKQKYFKTRNKPAIICIEKNS